MQPEHFYFGGGVSETVMHPAVAMAMVLAIVLILLLPRQKVIIPFLFVTFLIPLGQTLVLDGIHFYVLRIVLLFGCARMLGTMFSSPGSIFGGGFNNLDRTFLLWVFIRATAFLILFAFRKEAVVSQGGYMLDALGGFFFLRFLIHDKEDILRTVKAFAVVVAIIAVCMLNEKLRDQNVFGYLGGFPIAPAVRDGAIRAQGPFEHPILAGSFAATLLPLFFWLWQSGTAKSLAVLGMIGSTCMVLTCASSTPLMAYVAGIFGVCFWPLRKKMRAIRWGLVIGLVALHLVMKAPVWFLIARVDLTGASSGYHRAMLVDQFIKHVGEWWVVGTNTNSAWGFDMWDLSNQFVAEGASGGVATFICFIGLISICFSRIGTARKAAEGDRSQEWFIWFLGVALFSHMVAFFGISYFDHIEVSWFALLAMISAATTCVGRTHTILERPANDTLWRARFAVPSWSNSNPALGPHVKAGVSTVPEVSRSPRGRSGTRKT